MMRSDKIISSAKEELGKKKYKEGGCSTDDKRIGSFSLISKKKCMNGSFFMEFEKKNVNLLLSEIGDVKFFTMYVIRFIEYCKGNHYTIDNPNREGDLVNFEKLFVPIQTSYSSHTVKDTKLIEDILHKLGFDESFSISL